MWQEKLVLNDGESLKLEGSRTKGFMGEEEIDIYAVVRPDGTKIGAVTVSDHTAVKGFKRTIWVVQQDVSGRTIVDTRFNPD